MREMTTNAPTQKQQNKNTKKPKQKTKLTHKITKYKKVT